MDKTFKESKGKLEIEGNGSIVLEEGSVLKVGKKTFKAPQILTNNSEIVCQEPLDIPKPQI